ncbi:MAG: nitroreductase, partial [Actinobacteria bacterium]|nr:nitroreductase [Actinomycetota bacterium]
MDILTALRTKRDTRAYTDDPVDEEVLGRVLDAARMAGAAKNKQPVRLVVVTDHDDKVALSA